MSKSNIIFYQFETKELDAGNAPQIKSDLIGLLETSPNLVLELDSLEFIDSSGLGAILTTLRAAQKLGGEVKLCGVTKSVRTILELVRINRIMDILNDREEALRAFGVSESNPRAEILTASNGLIPTNA